MLSYIAWGNSDPREGHESTVATRERFAGCLTLPVFQPWHDGSFLFLHGSHCLFFLHGRLIFFLDNLWRRRALVKPVEGIQDFLEGINFILSLARFVLYILRSLVVGFQLFVTIL